MSEVCERGGSLLGREMGDFCWGGAEEKKGNGFRDPPGKRREAAADEKWGEEKKRTGTTRPKGLNEERGEKPH